MRETASGTALAIWGTIIFCVCLGIVMIFTTGMQAKLMPWWFAVERQAVEQSKGFIDSQTQGQLNKIAEYAKLETDKTTASAKTVKAIESQQAVIYNMVCSQTTKMATGTVAREVREFLTEYGKCRPN